jgi:RNA-dependent RNA polymerase
VASLVSNEAALSVLRDKVLHVLPWSEISHHPHLSQEPFFGRLLYTTISNNLYQLVTRAHIHVQNARYMFGIVDEYKVLNEGQVFVQIINEDGSRTVLKGPIAITKNPCRHPGDLRILEAVDNEDLHHHCDVLIFPQQGSRPHASEISGSDLDGDEYTVIWDPYLIPTTPNPSPYAYDSGPPPIPLDRVVTREDRLKVISDICAQDNLGRLSNIHLVIGDKLGIHSEDAVSLAGGLSQELDSVKSGQHPYTAEQIKEINMKAGTTRPDYMQAGDYEEYPSDKILGKLYIKFLRFTVSDLIGKLFRSAHRLSSVFSNAFSVNNNRVSLDRKLLYDGYKNYIDFAQNLYRRYQYEMLEIIGSYGFSNEIDLFCCVESRNMKANERSDVQQTSKELLKAVFKDIRKKFYQDTVSNDQTKAKAAALYYVAYNDQGPKDKRMLSFPWLFASKLLEDYDSILDDDFMKKKLNSDSPLYNRLQQQTPSILNILPDDDNFNFKNLFEICFQTACATNDEQMVNQVEMVIEELIKIAKDTYSN